jgi:hypothetical protein
VLDHGQPRFMSSVFIHEITAEGLLIRFMGTELVSRWGRDMTGSLMGAHYPRDVQDRLLWNVGQVVSVPCGMIDYSSFPTSRGHAMATESVILALRVDAGRPPRLLTFSQLLNAIDDNEHGVPGQIGGESSWIDLGSGVPSESPRRP